MGIANHCDGSGQTQIHLTFCVKNSQDFVRAEVCGHLLVRG